MNAQPLAQDLYAARAAGITGSPTDASTSLLQRQRHDVVRLAMGRPAALADLLGDLSVAGHDLG